MVSQKTSSPEQVMLDPPPSRLKGKARRESSDWVLNTSTVSLETLNCF
jgi:ABC-type uncharacterized transport system YnjBCD ATPase subunit